MPGLDDVVAKIGQEAPGTLAAGLTIAWIRRRNADPANFPADLLARAMALGGSLKAAADTPLGRWSEAASGLHKSIISGQGFQGADARFRGTLPDLMLVSAAEFRTTVPHIRGPAAGEPKTRKISSGMDR